MNKLATTITFALLFIGTIALPSFSQNNDDDGDGIPNSEDACPGTKGTRANKGCLGPGNKAGQGKPTAVPKSTATPTQKPTPVVVPIASPTPTATSKPTPTKTLTPAPNNQLSDCRYIIDDPGCNKFFGMPKSKITSDFGIGNKYGSYTDIGIFFYLNGLDDKEVVDEITFYGTSGEDSEYFKPYFGQPSKSLDWNSTVEEVTRLYGEPTSRWQHADKPQSSLRYDDSLRLVFENNKLVKIVLRDPRADARYLARRVAESEKEARESQLKEPQTKAKSEATQMQADYETLLDTIERYNAEGMRIVNSERLAIAAGGMFKAAVEKKLDRVKANMDSSIDSFAKKYGAKIPAWMIKGIQAKRAGQ